MFSLFQSMNLDIDDQFRRSISEKLICVYHSSSMLQNYASDLEDLLPSIEQLELLSYQNYEKQQQKREVQDLEHNSIRGSRSKLNCYHQNTEDSESEEDDMSLDNSHDEKSEDVGLIVQQPDNGLVEGVKRYHQKEVLELARIRANRIMEPTTEENSEDKEIKQVGTQIR
eukprot:TRINITY_DN6401_c0_g1_i2.p1 TRINITY_DN6401_c0_g1~~TRINITY_DN6401_c0_g1_i2.p1  ORF type:complete len:170 (+),score=9.14 TRINITY_DN6401_c0_g1_i2:57-566(+)